MATSTSPYTQNDYQAVSSYRPYQLPVNDIFKAISAQSQFWEQGAARVKNVYNNALDLKLRTTENKEIRDQFLKDSEKSLQKLSSMNLADPTVQRQGMDIFKPLFRDENIVGEDFVVGQMEKELSTGESFRLKDDGKGYNPMSIENIQFEQSLLNGPLNKRDGWRSLYGNLSKYTPHADVSKEYKQIADLVKAEEIKKAEIAGDGWYIQEIEKKGVSKDRILGAIQEMGSPQLKQQMRVEGRNTYYKKLAQGPEAVDAYFQGLAGNYYNTKISEMKSKKAELEYEDYMTPNKPEYSSKKESYKKSIEELGKNITKIETQDMPEFISSFQGLSDFSKLSSNLSKIEQLWESSTIDNIASKLKYENTSFDIKANPVKIAQENINVAYSRIQQDYDQLAETKRHNKVQEQIDWFNAMKPKEGDKENGSSSGNDLLPGGTSNIPVNYTTPSQQNSKDYQELALNTIKALEDSDEPLRQVAISNILGDEALAGIQGAVAENKRISEGVLTESEITKAANFFKAFADKYGGSNEIAGVYLGKNSADQFKNIISNMDVAKFKRMLGKMIKHDSDFTSDLIGKLQVENGDVAATNFKSAYNETLRNQLNLSNTIGNKVSSALGQYAKYFTDNGKKPLTDAEIYAAYERAKNDTRQTIEVTPIIGVPGGAVRTRVLTPEEAKNYKGSGRLINAPMSRDDFKTMIRRLTNPVYYNLAVENNQAGKQYTYSTEKKREGEKTATINRLETISPDIQGTDARPEMKEVYDFIKKNAAHVTAHEIKTPNVGESVPSVRFTMENVGGDNSADREMVDKVNNTWFRVSDKNLAKYFKTENGSSNLRYTGAYIVHSPVKVGSEQGKIDIINISRSPDKIVPEINVDNVYILDKEGNKRFITADDIKREFKTASGGIPIEQYIQTNPEEVNKFISAFVMNIEKQIKNKK